MKNKRLVLSRTFEKSFQKLPKEIRLTAYEKLELFLENPAHPSLRVKPIKGTDSIWELSVTMNYRITFEVLEDHIFLRKIGTHDILYRP